MSQTIWFSNQNFQFSQVNGNYPRTSNKESQNNTCFLQYKQKYKLVILTSYIYMYLQHFIRDTYVEIPLNFSILPMHLQTSVNRFYGN